MTYCSYDVRHQSKAEIEVQAEACAHQITKKTLCTLRSQSTTRRHTYTLHHSQHVH